MFISDPVRGFSPIRLEAPKRSVICLTMLLPGKKLKNTDTT